jgi:hypothetical protein
MTDKTRSQVRFDDVIWNKLKVIAEIDRRSVNGLLEVISENFIKQYETEHGVIVLTK